MQIPGLLLIKTFSLGIDQPLKILDVVDHNPVGVQLDFPELVQVSQHLLDVI